MPVLDHTPARDHVDDRLQRDPIIWLATVRPDGRPHIVPVWFYWTGETAQVISQPCAQKVKNLRHNPAASVSLDHSAGGGDVIVFDAVATLESEPASHQNCAGLLQKYGKRLNEMEWTAGELLGDYSQVITLLPTRFLEF